MALPVPRLPNAPAGIAFTAIAGLPRIIAEILIAIAASRARRVHPIAVLAVRFAEMVRVKAGKPAPVVLPTAEHAKNPMALPVPRLPNAPAGIAFTAIAGLPRIIAEILIAIRQGRAVLIVPQIAGLARRFSSQTALRAPHQANVLDIAFIPSVVLVQHTAGIPIATPANPALLAPPIAVLASPRKNL